MLGNVQCPSALVAVPTNVHEAAARCLPTLACSGTRALVKGLFVGCKFECSVPAQRPSGLCLLASLPVPFQHKDPRSCVSWPLCPSPSSRKTYPNRCKTAVLRMLRLVGGAVGGGSRTLRIRGAGTVKSCYSPGGPQVLGAPDMGFLLVGPSGFAGWGPSPKGRVTACSRVPTCLGILFSSLSLRRVQPYDPRGLRLQKCDTSQVLGGLRGI